MDTGNGQNSEGWVHAAPFALIVAGGSTVGDDAQLAAAFRRMGLRPETGDDPSLLKLHFGAFSLHARRADAATIAMADPAAPGTSLISHPLPPDWRDSGHCLTFIPSVVGKDGADGSARANALREFFKVMVLLIDLFEASHLYWSAAQLWSDAAQFREAVAEMLVSGMPPVLHLVAFRAGVAGDAAVVGTRGLAHFSGQELAAHCPPDWTMPQITRRLARVALDMILNGAVATSRRYRGLEPGEWMLLTPQLAGSDAPAQVEVAFRFDHA